MFVVSLLLVKIIFLLSFIASVQFKKTVHLFSTMTIFLWTPNYLKVTVNKETNSVAKMPSNCSSDIFFTMPLKPLKLLCSLFLQ